MNIFPVLNDDEIKKICSLIPGTEYKRYFQMYSKEFTKIKPGFRPNKRSDSELVNLAISNRNKPFISQFLNDIVEKWILEIKSELILKREEYADSDEALAQTLIDSFFAEDVDLYLKLTEFISEDESVNKITSRIKELQLERHTKKDSPIRDDSSIVTESTEIEHNESYISIVKEKEDLQADNDSMRITIEELQKKLSNAEFEIKHYKEMQKYDDSLETIIKLSSEYETLSFCEVSVTDYYENQFVLRLADITEKGDLIPFVFDTNSPQLFLNRSKLFKKDGPSKNGDVGVWEWKAVPNDKDPSKDYVISHFNGNVLPIEIISLSDCDTYDDIIKRLNEGIPLNIETNRILFSTKSGAEPYYGIACYKKDLDHTQSVYRINESVISLPVYKFTSSNIVFLDNNKKYYKNVNLGIPFDVVHVKNQLEIVKTIVLGRSSWNAFKQIGKSRNDWKVAKDFISQIDTNSIVAEIANACNCSSVEANSLYQEFLERVNVYINGESLDDELLLAVISKNDELLNRCKLLLETEWKQENAEMVETKEKEIEELMHLLEEKQAELSLSRKELDEIKTKIAEQLEFSNSVKESVDRKIKEAQNNAAEFIASMAFTSPHIVSSPVSTNEVASSCIEKADYITSNIIENQDQVENTNWEEAIDTISYELVSAGVMDKYARSFAAYLHSAVINNIPLLITGPNASEIADAYTIGALGRTAGTLHCEGEYSQRAIDAMIESGDSIVKITNPFNLNWIQRLEEISNKQGIYTFVIYPFSEDLLVEPKSLYSNFIPVYTDLIVDKKPSFDYVGGKKSEDYTEFKSNKPLMTNRNVAGLRMPPLSKTNVSKVLMDMKEMLGEDNSDYDVLFALLPYSHATLQITRVMDMINGNNTHKIDISSEVKKQLNSLYGESNG